MRELSLHILDLIQNSLAVDAKRIGIEIDEDLAGDRLTVVIWDDGRGMTPEMAQQAVDPFFTSRTTRKVGLGLPLFAQQAEACGGRLSITSQLGRGTTVRVDMQLSHIDRAPLGSMADTMVMLVACNPAVSFYYRHRLGANELVLDTNEIHAILGEQVGIAEPAILCWLNDYLREEEKKLMEVPGV